MKRNFLTYIFLCILFLGSAACQDDLLYNGGEIGEGESLVSATVKFKNLTPALNGNTRTAGDIIKQIYSLHVVLYNEKGKLLKIYELQETTNGTLEEGEYKLTDADRKGATNTETIGDEKKDFPSAETSTPHAEIKLKIPYGRYMMYAVANISDLNNNEKYAESIQTAEGLKSISLEWQEYTPTGEEEEAKKYPNNQMFGHFTVTGSVQEGEEVVINNKSMKLHAWLRRAASKVTIAYDGSDLHENVYIYLKSVTIKDIPTECYLGKESTINMDPNDDIENYGKLIDGESITYATGKNYYEHWPARITKGKPYYYIDGKKQGVSVLKDEYNADKQGYAKLAHGETNEALFFYENMQGTGKDKRQDATGPDGTPDGELDAPGLNNKPGDQYYKDQKPYGTYIEVKAYYVSNADGHVGNGDITYRFMLGKDIYKDYNAERNHHYKLTLKFNKYANDVDWHIEYEEPEPGIEVPNPYYISYLYNHSMMLPLKIRTGGKKIKEIEARIVDNRWAPNNPNEGFTYYRDMDLEYQNMHNGFLSLRKTKDLNIVPPGDSDKFSYNKAYYEKEKKGERTYIEKAEDMPLCNESKEYDSDEDNGHGQYVIRNEGDSVYHLQLPMYTRAKQLVKETGYTGNNPYVAYQRKAEVKIVVTFTDGTKISTDNYDFDGTPVTNSGENKKNPIIYQVRRIVNPKGVWRSHDRTDKFHVQLTRLPMENATRFETFTSEGPWKAYIYCGTEDFISLSNNNDNTTLRANEVGGETGSIIDFTINFNGTCASDKNRYAIIRVEYHNYTCYHLIFVRQGDAPDDLFNGTGTKWHAYNLRTKSTETSSPLEEGSLFKFNNFEDPIDAMSNKNNETYWINVSPNSFKDAANDDLTIATDAPEEKRTKKWDNITPCDLNPWEVDDFQFAGLRLSNARIASYKDFYALYSGENIAEGYGVLYGNDSQNTLYDITEAYGYDYTQTNRGMRGCFVYNTTNGKNLFFPIGASGYGHRKHTDNGKDSDKTKWEGVLRYSGYQNGFYPTANSVQAPLFYDIYMRPGAVYWLNQYTRYPSPTPPNLSATVIRDDWQALIAWDFNYFTFDFYPYSSSAAQKGKNACFIRCVEDKPTTTR